MTTRTPFPEVKQARVYVEYNQQICAIPLYASRVSAGYPSPAEDYIEQYVDLNKELVKNPASTFLVIASGDSMVNAGIQSGDMLVVDQKIQPRHGSIVIAAIDGELTVKRLSVKHDVMQLLPENPSYPPIVITAEQHVVIWGVVTFVIKKDVQEIPRGGAMIEIDHTLLAPETLDNLIVDVITRQTIGYGDMEMHIANKKDQILRKLESGKATIVYSHQEGFCNIISSDDYQKMKNQQESQRECCND